jgi:hypothetical protein
MTVCVTCKGDIDIHATGKDVGTVCLHRGEIHLACHELVCLHAECVEDSCKFARCEARATCSGCAGTWCVDHSTAYIIPLEHCSTWDEMVCRQCHLDRCAGAECWEDPDATYDAMRDMAYERI